MNKFDLMRSFAEFLNRRDWDIWMTVTSRKPMSTEDARRSLKYFLKCLNGPERHFYDRCIWLWAFFEKNAARDGIHIHAVIDGVDTSKCTALEDECRDFWGLSQVVPMHDGVLPYLAKKYAYANTLDDFDFMKINSKYRKFRMEEKDER